MMRRTLDDTAQEADPENAEDDEYVVDDGIVEPDAEALPSSPSEAWPVLEKIYFGTYAECNSVVKKWKTVNRFVAVGVFPEVYSAWGIPSSAYEAALPNVCLHCRDYSLHCSCRHIARSRNKIEPGLFKKLWEHRGPGRKKKDWTSGV